MTSARASAGAHEPHPLLVGARAPGSSGGSMTLTTFISPCSRIRAAAESLSDSSVLRRRFDSTSVARRVYSSSSRDSPVRFFVEAADLLAEGVLLGAEGRAMEVSSARHGLGEGRAVAARNRARPGGCGDRVRLLDARRRAPAARRRSAARRTAPADARRCTGSGTRGAGPRGSAAWRGAAGIARRDAGRGGHRRRVAAERGRRHRVQLGLQSRSAGSGSCSCWPGPRRSVCLDLGQRG